MAKTEVVLAFTQMPEDMQTPFKALYPEIVPETPVSIVIDPEARSLEFTVGAREMVFGPSNENYSVFLNGCYRMLFAAAQKAGWLSQYPVEAAAQEAPAQAPAAAAAPAPEPAPVMPPAPADPMKIGTVTGLFKSVDDAIKTAKAEEGEWVVVSENTGEVKKTCKNKGEATKVYNKMNKADGGYKMMSKKSYDEKQPKKKKKEAAVDPILSELKKGPEIKSASTDPSPKGADKLYVRPLDFVNNLREDWQTWADAHGGPESMHQQGVLDLVTQKELHMASVNDIADRSGWSKEAYTWSNPKGLQTADDSKLVAQLRTGGIKTALPAAVPPPPAPSAFVEVQGQGQSGSEAVKSALNSIIKAQHLQMNEKAYDSCYNKLLKNPSLPNMFKKDAKGTFTISFNPKVVEAISGAYTAAGGAAEAPAAPSNNTVNAAPATKNGPEGFQQTTDVTLGNGNAADAIDAAQKAYQQKHQAPTPQKTSKKAAWYNEPELDALPADLEGEGPAIHEFDLDDPSEGDFEKERKDADIFSIYQDEVGVPHSGPQKMNPAELEDVQTAIPTAGKGIPGFNSSTQFNTASTKVAEDGEKQLMDHTDNPVEKLADGTQKPTEIKDETQVKEVATAKSASSATFRPGKAAGLGDLFKKKDPIEDYVKKDPSVLDKHESLDAQEDAKVRSKSLTNGVPLAPHYSSTKVARHSDADPIHGTFAGFPITIDCPAGSTVSGTGPDGTPWEQTQAVNYGEIDGSMGGDNEPIDVFLGPDTNSPWVFIVNQTRPEDEVGPGEVCNELVPDEIKVGLGFASVEEAEEAYLSMFPAGWDNYDSNIITASVDSFREWMEVNQGAKSVTADDFTLTTKTPEAVAPALAITPEVMPHAASYKASVKEVHSQDMADVFTSFHDASARPMDHTSATLANLISTQVGDHTRGHVASLDAHTRPSINDAVKVSVETHKANLVPSGTSSSRIAEIITADLNMGLSPAECKHRASTVGFYGADEATFTKTLGHLAGIVGNLVLQPNLIKNSCVATHAALTSAHRATRNRTAFHSVAQTTACAGCEHCKCATKGEKHCALYQKPIVASVGEMHKIADKVWGPSNEALTTTGLNKRAAAHMASLNSEPVKSPIDKHTAATAFTADAAENRPAPVAKTAAAATGVNPGAYVIASLSQGLTPSRITDLVQRSVTHNASFKEAAMKELNTQKGLMGFLTILPNFAGPCANTHAKHFSALTSKDRRKTAFHSVLKVSACEGCQHCVKTASGNTRCSLYGKPVVATVMDLRKVASEVFPSLASKIANATKEELAQAALPFLAKSLGIPEDHPSLQAFQVAPGAAPETVEIDIDKLPDVEGGQGAVEGASKNVMDIALTSSKPATKDLEDITVKVKAAFVQGKTSQQVYDQLKTSLGGKVSKVELQRMVKTASAASSLETARSNSNDRISSVNDKSFGEHLKKLADGHLQADGVSLNDNTINLNEFAEMPRESDEFDAIQGFLQ